MLFIQKQHGDFILTEFMGFILFDENVGLIDLFAF
jgi:hypothetical protein